jgi:hypothetical protein
LLAHYAVFRIEAEDAAITSDGYIIAPYLCNPAIEFTAPAQIGDD